MASLVLFLLVFFEFQKWVSTDVTKKHMIFWCFLVIKLSSHVYFLTHLCLLSNTISLYNYQLEKNIKINYVMVYDSVIRLKNGVPFSLQYCRNTHIYI